MSLLEKCREVADKPGCGYVLDVAALARLVVEAAEIIARVPEVCDVADFDTLKLGFQARAWLRKVEKS